MAEPRLPRRLAAILAADVVGYARLMGQDEAGTLAALKSRRQQIIDPVLATHAGRLFKVMGDGILVEFGSAIDAVQCGLDLQAAFSSANEKLPSERHMVLRIGINLGDIIVEGDDIYGDGVNIAARLEQIADAGSILVSDDIQRHTIGKVGGNFVELGERFLKNVEKPIRIWRWQDNARNNVPTVDKPGKPERAVLSLPEKPSVAVLPFDNMTHDPEQDYFADGVVEALTAALSRIKSFFVIARNSAFTYKGRPTNVRDIGRELGVG